MLKGIIQKTLYFSFFISVFHGSSQPITFQLRFSNAAQEDVVDVIQNSQGNYIIATNTFTSSSSFDAGFIEVSPTGAVLKTKRVSTTGSELIKTIVQTSDGGYLVTGSFFVTANDYDWLVMKLDTALNLTWYKRYGVTGVNDFANAGMQIASNRYSITGSLSLGGSTKPAVVTLSGNGNVISQGYLNTNQFASPDYKGRYLGNGVIGFSHLANSVTLVDTLCNIISNYSFALGTYSTDVRKKSNGLIAFSAVGDYGSPTGSSVVLAVLDDGLTNIIHSARLTSSGNDLTPVEFITENDGSFLIAANSYNKNSGSNSPLLIKTDSAGAVLWCNNYKPSTATNCQMKALIRTTDHGYLLAGRMSSGGAYSVFIAKLDSAGNSGCNTVPFALTSVSNTPNVATPHIPFTGAITTLTPLATSSAALTYIKNVICTTVGIEEQPEDKVIRIQPTLFSEGFLVNYGGIEQARLTIYDSRGIIVLTRTIQGNEWIPASELAAGFYMVSITTARRSYYKKIMKIFAR